MSIAVKLPLNMQRGGLVCLTSECWNTVQDDRDRAVVSHSCKVCMKRFILERVKEINFDSYINPDYGCNYIIHHQS